MLCYSTPSEGIGDPSWPKRWRGWQARHTRIVSASSMPSLRLSASTTIFRRYASAMTDVMRALTAHGAGWTGLTRPVPRTSCLLYLLLFNGIAFHLRRVLVHQSPSECPEIICAAHGGRNQRLAIWSDNWDVGLYLYVRYDGIRGWPYERDHTPRLSGLASTLSRPCIFSTHHNHDEGHCSGLCS